MLRISPVWLGGETDIQETLSYPVTREDHRIYVTRKPEFARMLAERKLPSIYIEESSAVYGVDLILREEEGVTEELTEELLYKVWQRHYHLPWTIAEKKRLIIRESIAEDLPFFLKLYERERRNPDVLPFSDQPEEELKAYIENRYPLYGYGLWTVVEKHEEKVIGRAGLQEFEMENTELSYLIDFRYRRQGYAREAAEAILTYCREELAMKTVYLRTSSENIPSNKMAKTLGFERYTGFLFHQEDCEKNIYWKILKID